MTPSIFSTAISETAGRRRGTPRWLAPFHMAALARQRRQLATLTDAQLADMGISRAEAEQEAARPFWDAPAHWKSGL